MKRRLVLIVVWLAVLDCGVRPILDRLERRHYEAATAFRFENSDLFALGPLVDYLREHREHEQRRVVFFGNSMMFGYGLNKDDAIPAQYQRLQRQDRVYNAAINGQEIGTSYLVAKDVIDSVDVMYVQLIGADANPLLPSLIPVDAADIRRFHLTQPDRTEQLMRSWLGRVWRLYALNDRVQAALFGTSTRVFVFTRVTGLLRVLHVAPAQRSGPLVNGRIVLRAPRKPGVVSSTTEPQRIRNDLAAMARSHRKRVVFVEFEYAASNGDDDEIAAFNAAFAPYAEIVAVRIPPAWTFDGLHPVSAATPQIAAALAQHEAAR